MEKGKLICFEVYGYMVHLIYTKDIVASRKKREDVLGYYDVGDNDDSYLDGLHSKKDKEDFTAYIFFCPKSTVGTIAHECYHAISRLCTTIGAEKEEEFFAYHLGYLVDECIKLKSRKD